MLIKLLFISAICIYFVSCTSESGLPLGSSGSDSRTQAGADIERINVSDADAEQCPSGGKIYSIYIDENGNGIADEVPLSEQIVCNGVDGSDGQDGANGHSVQFSVFPAAPEICSTGGHTILMALDIEDRGYYSITDPNQQQMTLCNGQDGENGQDGGEASTPHYSPVDVIFPCGNTVTYKEVLLRLQNGQILSSFSENISGLNTRLSLLPDGAFMNSDGSNCVFTISTSTDGLTRSISWGGQIQSSWPLQ